MKYTFKYNFKLVKNRFRLGERSKIMNITNIAVGLTGDDILSILNEFVSVEGLTVNSIDITDYILIKGNFKKGVSIDFECGLRINSTDNYMIQGEICKFKVLNIGIASFFRKMALKFALKAFADKGISYKEGKIININIY